MILHARESRDRDRRGCFERWKAKRSWPRMVSLASEKRCEKTAGTFPRREETKPLPPRLPSEASAKSFAAGLRTCRPPTNSASQLDQSQCHCERSCLLTAAGQLRICTGFPFHPPPETEEPRN